MKYTGRVGLPILAFFSWMFLIFYSQLFYGNLDYIYILCAIVYIVFGWFLGKNYDIAKFYSEKDYLTQTYNRRYAFNALPKLLTKMNQRKKELSLFVVDVDKFKQINDTYGHDMGDTVLKNIAALLKSSTRKSDFVTRWGGDEFLIVAPYANKNDASIIINRIEKQLQEVSIQLSLELSLSIGVSVYPDNAVEMEELISLADKNMYITKSEKSHGSNPNRVSAAHVP
ncbi:GGDEF domain-containing protein [Paenibacillus radicis (ex Xue et al. 2023)]|uniref:GGDEF domain-containing protein n=1 Tax=Paenibacillus radicis (ex Xue et al. 2023) TaxID=2972489 RepID=A0ABT1YA31_9BACL|nr:GGDEF domain-containing protein [Paenibacillus radicis (ex Xue et al. 2023)]MCR8630054.1 GGDEF domain-containing protein [Paenibacillus radicis (ex Xue et al. 2023)]